MDEDFAMLLTFAFMAVSAYAIFLRFSVVRRLRKKLAQNAGPALEGRHAAAALPAAAAPAQDSELRQIKERLKVLERIAVEKENALAREIEDLRATG